MVLYTTLLQRYCIIYVLRDTQFIYKISSEDDHLYISFNLGDNMPLHRTSSENSSKCYIPGFLLLYSWMKQVGNQSKKWNKLETYSFFLASLPREEITKFSNINFVCV